MNSKLIWRWNHRKSKIQILTADNQQIAEIDPYYGTPEESEQMATLWCASITACASALVALEYINNAHPGLTGAAQRAERRAERHHAEERDEADEVVALAPRDHARVVGEVHAVVERHSDSEDGQAPAE